MTVRAEIIDWYDGYVDCIRAEEDGEYWYSLVARDIDQKSVVYVKTRLTTVASHTIHALLREKASPENWQEIQRWMASVNSDHVQVCWCAETLEKVIRSEPATLDSIRLQIGQGIEFATDEDQIKRWLGDT